MNKSGERRWVVFAALRYLFSRSSRRYMSARFTIAGLAVGFTAICVVIGVMNGLQEGFLSDLIEIESFHIIASPAEGTRSDELREELLAYEEVESAVLFYDVHAMIRTFSGGYHPFIIRGIEQSIFTEDEQFISRARLYPEFEQFTGERTIIPSRYVQRLAAVEDRQVTLVMMGTGRTVRNVPLTLQADISHTFMSSSADLNTSLAFMPLETIMMAQPDKQPLLGLKLYSPDMLSGLESRLTENKRIAEIQTWKERNQSFYSALMLEKYGMMVLLSLIFLVVIINAKVSFEKYVFYKKDDIGILRALGASRISIGIIFQLQGVVITLFGMLIGVGIGYLAALNINEIIGLWEQLLGLLFQRQFSLLAYELPVSLHAGEILVLAVIVLLFSLLHIHLAVTSLIKKNPLEILRYE